MVWTIEQIEEDWLAASRVAISPQDVVTAFERCETVLGRNWINAQHHPSPVGPGPTLAVFRTGQRLASLDCIAHARVLIEKLRRDDRSAGAELHALHLLRFGRPYLPKWSLLDALKDLIANPTFALAQQITNGCM